MKKSPELTIMIVIISCYWIMASGVSSALPNREISPLARHKRLADLRKSRLTEMIPQQSCYYQGYNQRLTCTCSSSDDSSFLHLNMKYYVFDAGNKIKSVHIRSCKELLVNLDLKMVDATDVPFYFRAIRKVQIEQIQFEPAYSATQELQLVFNNVEKLLLKDLFVEDTLKIIATNIKEAHLVGSTFAHIPSHGIAISRAKTLNIRDSRFLRVSASSVTVEDTKEVTVVKNEMSKNALEVIVAKDGSHLMISCNRLFNHPESPECSKIKFTTTTTTTTTVAPFLVNQGNLREGESLEEENANFVISPELIGGILGGILVIVIIISMCICFILAKKKRKREPEEQEEQVQMTPDGNAEEKEELLEKEPKDQVGKEEMVEDDLELGAEELDEDGRPRFVSPIWLEEIQKNKIFNRQKSLLSEEGLKDIAEGTKLPTYAEEESELARVQKKISSKKSQAPQPPTQVNPAQPSEDEDVKESSRTESEEEVALKNGLHQEEGLDQLKKAIEKDPQSEQDLPGPDHAEDQTIVNGMDQNGQVESIKFSKSDDLEDRDQDVGL